MQNRWFTRWLCGVENGIEHDPPFAIVREGGKRSELTTYADWPNPDAKPITLRPRAGGLGIGALDAGPTADTAKETLVDDVEKTGTTLAKAAKSEHRLLYALPKLTAPLHISGTPKLTVRVACDKPAANLSVWLVSLPWKGGRSVGGDIVTRGWADPRNHSSIDDEAPLEPGRFYDLTFELEPDDQVDRDRTARHQGRQGGIEAAIGPVLDVAEVVAIDLVWNRSVAIDFYVSDIRVKRHVAIISQTFS